MGKEKSAEKSFKKN